MEIPVCEYIGARTVVFKKLDTSSQQLGAASVDFGWLGGQQVGMVDGALIPTGHL